jgi:TPR repeat protein
MLSLAALCRSDFTAQRRTLPEVAMLDSSFWYRSTRLSSLMALTLAAALHASPGFGQTGAPPSAPSLLAEPPKLAYGKVCISAPPPLPLAMDWTGWDGKDRGVPADQVLSDATTLADGSNAVSRDRALARRMLTFIASGTTTSAPEAKARLATLLLDPKSGPTDIETAKRLLTEATASQRTGAALSMGRLIREGRLPGLTITDAARYLGIAAGLGDPAAALELAAIYAAPGAPLPFPDAAAHFATLAAINVQTGLVAGNCGIAVDVGDHLIESDPKNGAALAARWFEIAAGAGDVRALARLARMHETGEGQTPDPAAARQLWDRAAAGGLVRAYAPAARLRLAAGEDIPAAVDLLHAAMANDDPDGYLIAARYYRGDYTGKADFAAMRQVLDAAMTQTDVSIFTIETLAYANLTGQGGPVDRKQAHELYQRILASGLADGEAIYGRYIIREGLGLKEGVGHLESAAAKGSQTAHFQRAELAFCRADDTAEDLLRQAGAAGSTTALRRLARLASDRGDIETALGSWRQAASLGDRVSMVELAANAVGTGTRASDAADLVRRAGADGPGVIEGRLALAVAFRSGRFGEMAAEGDRLLDQLADSGSPEVDVERARYLAASATGATVEDIAVLLQRAATAGNGEAMYLLSHQPQQQGSGNPRDWLVRAAEMGDVNALKELPSDDAPLLERVLAALGQRPLCDIPRLVQQARLQRLQGDAAAATATMTRAEKLAYGRPREIHALAEAYATQGAGAADNTAKAATLFEQGANAGYSKSGLALAGLYASGRLGDRDADAIDWYLHSALAGEMPALRELVRYASGQANQANPMRAMNALQQIAEQDNAAAMQAYGSLLATLGPERQEEGMAMLEKAAGKGDVQAMKTLARLFAAGLTGTVSAEQSTRWTRLAAEKGDPEAMFQYAIALDLGFGVAVDRAMAQTWQQKAKQNGFLR